MMLKKAPLHPNTCLLPAAADTVSCTPARECAQPLRAWTRRLDQSSTFDFDDATDLDTTAAIVRVLV